MGLVICRDSREARIPRQDEGQHQNPQHRLENPQNQRPTVVSTQEIRKTVPSDRRAA